MKIKQITKILEAEILTSPSESPDVKMACGSDLLSDVLVHIKKDSILLTGLTNIQVVYTASTAGVKAICFVRGKKPPDETVELAKKKGIALIKTSLHMYESCGKLYRKGLAGCSEIKEASEK